MLNKWRRRSRQIGIAFIIGIFCSGLLSSFGQTRLGAVHASPVIRVSPYWSGHSAEPCTEALTVRGVLDPYTLEKRFPNSAFKQGEFANAVLKAFPGAFAANNEYLGLTFNEAENEAEALLMAALGEGAYPNRYLGRAEALAILTSGSATAYQADATRSLSATFRDSLLIPKNTREGVAAALAAGYIVDPEGAASDGRHQLRPRRNTTIADGASFICRASLDSQVSETVGDEQVVAFIPPEAIAPPQSELRGVWMTNIDSDVLFSRSNLETALDQLSTLNFNTVYPTVWNWGYTLYPSQVAQQTTGYKQGLYPDLGQSGRQEALEAAQQNRDMLREIIELAHSRDLKVIPWFEFGFMAPADSALAQRHPDWLTQKVDGTLTTPEGSHERVWLNPFHPEVQAFILGLVDEISSNYDIDGFQVDDHMGLPFAYGYDAYTVELYKQDHDGQSPPIDAKDAEWPRWRADRITDFMGEVFSTLKANRSQAVMSVSPNPHVFAYEYYLQDWDTWLKRGYVEELIIQLYRNDLGRFVWEMGQEAAEFARSHIPTSVGVLSGLRTRSVPMSQIVEQVEAVRDRNYSGVSFFFYETLWNLSEEGTVEERQAALQEIFPNQAGYPRGRP